MALSNRRKQAVLGAGIALAAGLTLSAYQRVQSSDHAGTVETVARPGTDLSDLHIFPGANPDNVVLAMSVRPLIPAGQAFNFSFDPLVLYQFKIDTTGDFVEDLVIQAKFEGTGRNQRVFISGPAAPANTGIRNTFGPRYATVGTFNRPFEPAPGLRVFAGPRADPFFIDLEQLGNILPDRLAPPGLKPEQPPGEANVPRATSWRPPGQAQDFLANFNVLAIVVEMPRALLGGGVIRVWETTSGARRTPPAPNQRSSRATSPDPRFTYVQADRLARPVVNEVLATFAQRHHYVNDTISPINDPLRLTRDIESFMTFPAGRSRAIKDVIKAVLVPDVMVADLGEPGPATYLGVETGGATGGTFGGRALPEDVTDISLGIIFGNTIPALGLAPDDGKEIPSLTSDNVGAENKRYLRTFPYLGVPK